MQGGSGEPSIRRWKMIFQMQYEPTSVDLQRFAAGAASSETVGLIWATVAAAGLAVLLGWRVKRFLRRSR